MGSIELGEKLCTFARMGSKTKLTCYQLAGANLNTCNLSGQTALHAAIETGQKKIAQFLMQEKIDPLKKVTKRNYNLLTYVMYIVYLKNFTFRISME